MMRPRTAGWSGCGVVVESLMSLPAYFPWPLPLFIAAGLATALVIGASPAARAVVSVPAASIGTNTHVGLTHRYQGRRTTDADAWPALAPADEIAALQALDLALSELADGSSYVWYRRGGELNGIVQTTASFLDAGGRVCRHVIVLLASGTHERQTEGIACRLSTGAWQLGG